MVTTCSHVTFGGNGNQNQNPTYFTDDINQVTAQPNCTGTRSVNVIEGNEEMTALIGVDNRGNDLNQADNLLAMPCPPKCPMG